MPAAKDCIDEHVQNDWILRLLNVISLYAMSLSVSLYLKL